MFSILDYLIMSSGHGMPKDHTERFRTLEAYFPSLYEILDRLYPLYRNTYSASISKADCDSVRKNVYRIIEEQKIQI
jgi:hypothetical protein